MIEYRDMIQNNTGINVVALNMRILNILLNLYSRMTLQSIHIILIFDNHLCILTLSSFTIIAMCLYMKPIV